MAKVQGIGGVFLYAKEPKELADWYSTRLGLEFQNWGTCFGLILPSQDIEKLDADKALQASTTFSIMKGDDDQCSGAKTARLNWRVTDMQAMKDKLLGLGETLEDKEEKSEYGWFVWLKDPIGNRVELWQPPLASEG